MSAWHVSAEGYSNSICGGPRPLSGGSTGAGGQAYDFRTRSLPQLPSGKSRSRPLHPCDVD